MFDKAREDYERILQNKFSDRLISKSQMVEALAQYDAAQATIRNAKYALWSVFIAAIAAVASAISAAFSAYAAWPRK
jgi:hypothetical protein